MILFLLFEIITIIEKTKINNIRMEKETEKKKSEMKKIKCKYKKETRKMLYFFL